MDFPIHSKCSIICKRRTMKKSKNRQQHVRTANSRSASVCVEVCLTDPGWITRAGFCSKGSFFMSSFSRYVIWAHDYLWGRESAWGAGISFVTRTHKHHGSSWLQIRQRWYTGEVGRVCAGLLVFRLCFVGGSQPHKSYEFKAFCFKKWVMGDFEFLATA